MPHCEAACKRREDQDLPTTDVERSWDLRAGRVLKESGVDCRIEGIGVRLGVPVACNNRRSSSTWKISLGTSFRGVVEKARDPGMEKIFDYIDTVDRKNSPARMLSTWA